MTTPQPKPYPQEFYPGCPCKACVPAAADPFAFHALFHLCPQCGNKRCPGAANHENICGGSNEPGQPGSLYADTPRGVLMVSNEDRWYAVVDDTIGGWAIANVDKPVSEHAKHGEFTVGNFLTEEIARHLVDLHNRSVSGTSRDTRSVSNEDREAAIAIVGETLDTTVQGDMSDDDWLASMWPDESAAVVAALVSHGWGPARQIQIDTLLAARDAAREARRLCWAEERDEHTIRHWGATAGWLASRAKKIGAGEEPDWPDAANSARTEVLDD